MSYVPTNLYEVRLYDRDGVFQLIPKHITRIEFHQRLNAPWNHQITIELSDTDPDVAVLRTIEDDWFIRIFRTDPITQIKTLVYSGLHVTLVDQARSTGDLIFNLYGSGFTQLLTRRVVLPEAAAEYSVKTDAAESVIKSYVSDCMVSPTDGDRIFDDFTVEIDNGEGEYIEYSARNVNLMTVCENVADSGKLDFGVIEDGEVGKVVFRARAVWGKDRREGNPAGNREMVFSFQFGNMDIPIYTNNTSDLKNFIYIAGPGQGAQRQIETVMAPTASKWGRREAIIEARDQSTVSALLSAGNAYLEQKRQTETLSFDFIQTTGSRWLVDWELGDLITARYYDKVFDKKIIEVGVVITGELSATQPEIVTVEIEDVRL